MDTTQVLKQLSTIRSQIEKLMVEFGEAETEINSVKNTIIKYFDITEEDFLSKRRLSDANVWPRYFYFLFGRSLLNTSLFRLGYTSGNKDHATVTYGLVTLCNLIKAGDRAINYHYENLLDIFAKKGYLKSITRSFVKNRI